MSAEILRRAAALMRERATAATPGPWQATEDVDTGERLVWDARKTELAQVAEWSSGLGNPHHIASWHPAVALAVADWLERQQEHMEAIGYTGEGGVGSMLSAAHAVARAYLGAQP